MAAKKVQVKTETTTRVEFDELDLINILIGEARRMGLQGELTVDFEIRHDLLKTASVVSKSVDVKEQNRHDF